MDKRKIVVFALGVTDKWNPKPMADEIRKDVPFFRLTGLAIPMRTSRETTKEWNKSKDKDLLGLFGWRGTSFEMHDWTIGETYLKIRDAWERGAYAPLLFAPDMALSNEAATVVTHGDGVHFPPFVFAADTVNANVNPPDMRVLPFVTNANDPGLVGIVISHRTNPQKFRDMINNVAGEVHFVDPIAAATAPKQTPKVEVAKEVLK